MPNRNEQATAYLSEAETTLESARVLSERDPAAFASQIVKNAYDALEQAVSARIAARGADIPRRHGAKIQRFFAPLDADELESAAFEWHARRSDAQYVDYRGTDLSVPSENFDADDAESILEDADDIVEFVRRRVGDT